MKLTHSFFAPALHSTQSPVDTQALERSIDLYNEKRYLEAFHTLLDFLNPAFRGKYGNADGTQFHIPHGSILVDILVRDGQLYIGADFLKLPEKGRVAMLRQVCDLTLNSLLLPRFRKQGDRLKMEYTCPLSQSHPHKLYFVLRNICHVGDRYDDEFRTKFKAARCYEPCITSYPDAETDRIREAIARICRETLDAVHEYENERKYGYAWCLLDTALYKIAYVAHPQGQLTNDLDKAVDDLDRELPVIELVAKGKSFLERMAAMPREELAANLYYVDTLVSTKQRASIGNVQENLKDIYQEATEAIQIKDFERSAVRILYKLYEMYYYIDVQDDLNALVAQALEESAGKPMEEASAILYEAVGRIMEGDLEPDGEEPENGAGNDTPDSSADAAAAAAQAAAAAMSARIAQMQARMQEALSRGDTAEYMRLVAEFQQQITGQTEENTK